MTTLVIVESPAKAKTIQKYLGKNYKVVASMGHLRDLPKSQLGVDLEHNFEPRYITIRGKGDLVNKLKKEAKACDKIFLATDPDREGEAIAWHLAVLLGVDYTKKCRVTFNEITKTAVKAGVQNPRAIDLDLVDAQQARRVIDRILGYQLSPLLWRKIKKGLSAGRVQSVVTKMVVDREREIDAFSPDEYWTIAAQLLSKGSKRAFEARFYGYHNQKTDLTCEAEANRVLQEIDGKPFVVSAVKYGEKKKSPAPPFTTSTLQQEASKKLNFTAQRTMSTAQTLYEGVSVQGHGTIGLITYMRTDSLRISQEAQAEARAFLMEKFGPEYVPQAPRVYKSKKEAQDAHEAIRPTGMLEPDRIKASLTADQYKLYKLIWSRFIASQMESAVYETVNADITAGAATFKTSGQKIKFPGFTAVYTVADDEDEKDSKTLPALEEKEALSLKDIEAKQHFTEPPPRYTEASLIKTMEDCGIGRPSTYAPTVTTILGRGYVVREKKTLKPTEIGYVTTDLMTEYFQNIINVEFTAHMEDDLDDVEEGKEQWAKVVKGFYTPFESTLAKADEAIGKIEIKDEVSDVVCDKCGRLMVYKLGKFGKFLACPGFPECRNTKTIVVETGVRCPKCGGMIVQKRSQKGKKYFGCENAPGCDTVLWYEPTGDTCPACGSLMVKRYGKKVCSNAQCSAAQAKK